MSDRTTYIVLTGQDDNIGDSLLRRPYAQALREGSPIRVWAGSPSAQAGYISELGLHAAEIAPSYFKWASELWRDSFRGRANFAFNAGEFTVTRRGFAQSLSFIGPLALIKLRGRDIYWAGAAVRSTQRFITWPFRTIALWAKVLSWREATSSDRIGVAGTVNPDWAFALGYGANRTNDDGIANAARPYLAISLRGDQTIPPAEWFDEIKRLSERCNLTPIAVVQVRRDADRAGEIADRLGCAVVGWESESHDVQEKLVRDIYQRSSAIVSDRLHALIVAATEGAVPFGWTWHQNLKVQRHFAVIGLDDVALSGDTSIESLKSIDRDRLTIRGDDLTAKLRAATLKIRALELKLRVGAEVDDAQLVAGS